MKNKEFKISKYRKDGAKIFTGRDNGIAARMDFELNQIEDANEDIIINILIPSDTWGINPSFFGGLFESSIKKYGDSFTEKYKFLYTNHEPINESLRRDISDDIEYIIRYISIE